MTTEQRIELCRIYNGSDIDAFNYAKRFCDSQQKVLLDRVLELNEKCIENSSGTSEEVDEYFEKKWALLKSFGIEKDEMDEAVFEPCER